MLYFQLVQRITAAELLACPSCQSLVSDKRTSAISNAGLKDVVTPYTHISEASRYILYTIILTFDGICTLS